MTRTIRSSPSTTGPDGEGLPRYFSKNGHPDQDPNKVKKDGHGRGNWGREGEEVDDLEDEFNFHHARRRSNSISAQQRLFEERYQYNEEDVFDEEDEQ
ncbi:hypothetical protein TRICI_002595 [Trichomonascus ciferrii]|uniref:Hyaluronan/mRNA-binding protein domain-containing protein n=1 Tax=Trichomonascus ciferrii TaxID=44093 RepID=A0A642V5F3_9ASCO|nr:hypothetical protein TRICI_002595 [Trichomonascus ciferrii]